MALVYRNSWLTLSAALSSSPTTGCFNSLQATTVQLPDGVNDTLAILFPEAVKLRRDLRLYFRFSIAHPDFGRFAEPANNKPFPLLSRAWGYQERLLAPRVLHFGPQELFWACMQDLDSECGTLKWSKAQRMSGYMKRDTSGQLPPKISHYAALHVGGATTRNQPGDNALRQQKLLSRWRDMVQEYTRRNLTFPTDRLPAFSGVAAEMVERLPMEYCAGLWRGSLPTGLLWRIANSSVIGPSIREPLTAPSWSWASVNNVPIEYGACPRFGPGEEYAEVEEVRCVPSGKDPRGELRLAELYIVLSAEVVEGLLCFELDLSMASSGKRWMCVGDAIAKGVKRQTRYPQSFSVKVGNSKMPIPLSLDRKVWDKNED